MVKIRITMGALDQAGGQVSQSKNAVSTTANRSADNNLPISLPPAVATAPTLEAPAMFVELPATVGAGFRLHRHPLIENCTGSIPATRASNSSIFRTLAARPPAVRIPSISASCAVQGFEGR